MNAPILTIDMAGTSDGLCQHSSGGALPEAWSQISGAVAFDSCDFTDGGIPSIESLSDEQALTVLRANRSHMAEQGLQLPTSEDYAGI